MNDSETIVVSIIIPVKDDIRIFSLIQSLKQKKLNLQTTVELIVVCNGSTPLFINTIKQNFLQISNARCITIPTAHIAVAKNKGIRHAHGNFLYFIDSDCCIQNSFFDDLLLAVALLAPHKNTVVMGKNIFVGTLTSRISMFDTQLRTVAYSNRTDRTFTPNLLVSRRVFETYGLFPETIPLIATGEDSMWGYFAKTKGLKILYSKKLAVTHYSYESNKKIIHGWCRYAEARCYRIYFHLIQENRFCISNYLKKAIGKPVVVEKKTTITSSVLIVFYYLLRTTLVLKTSLDFVYLWLLFKKTPGLILPKLATKKESNLILPKPLLDTIKNATFIPNNIQENPTIVVRDHDEFSAVIKTQLKPVILVKKINTFLKKSQLNIQLFGPTKSVDLYSNSTSHPHTVRLRMHLPLLKKKKGSIVISDSSLCTEKNWNIKRCLYPVKHDLVIFIPECCKTYDFTTQYFFSNPDLQFVTALVFKTKYSGGYHTQSEAFRSKKIVLEKQKDNSKQKQPSIFLDSPSIEFAYQISTRLIFPDPVPKQKLQQLCLNPAFSVSQATSFFQSNAILYEQQIIQKIEIENAGAIFNPIRDQLVTALFKPKGFFKTLGIETHIDSTRTVPLKHM